MTTAKVRIETNAEAAAALTVRVTAREAELEALDQSSNAYRTASALLEHLREDLAEYERLAATEAKGEDPDDDVETDSKADGVRGPVEKGFDAKKIAAEIRGKAWGR